MNTQTDGGTWSEKVRKDTIRKVANARRHLDNFTEKLRRDCSGVFCVVFSERIQRIHEGSTEVQPAPFRDGILLLCNEICRLFPIAQPTSRAGQMKVSVKTTEQAQQLLEVSSILDRPVMASCRGLNQIWARITREDRGFIDADID